jgi:ABC-type enterobactin transport system permease subunit
LTLAALLLISQSITAGLFMGEVGGAFPLHREIATAAGIALMVALVAAILCVRLCGDARWPIWATLAMLALLSLQAFAGYRSLTALHIPLGVITIAVGSALAAWFWIPRPDAGNEPARSSSVGADVDQDLGAQSATHSHNPA